MQGGKQQTKYAGKLAEKEHSEPGENPLRREAERLSYREEVDKQAITKAGRQRGTRLEREVWKGA
jgi:uncharacterized protein RhaS with RHS repeats